MNLTMNRPYDVVIDKHARYKHLMAAELDNSKILKEKNLINILFLGKITKKKKKLPKMAELRSSQTFSLFAGVNCQPRGLDHGFE